MEKDSIFSSLIETKILFSINLDFLQLNTSWGRLRTVELWLVNFETDTESSIRCWIYPISKANGAAVSYDTIVITLHAPTDFEFPLPIQRHSAFCCAPLLFKWQSLNPLGLVSLSWCAPSPQNLAAPHLQCVLCKTRLRSVRTASLTSTNNKNSARTLPILLGLSFSAFKCLEAQNAELSPPLVI